MKRQQLLEIGLITALTIAALIVRVTLLREIPFGLHNDEAANGLDALAILEGNHAVFFPTNSGREALFLYLQAAALALVGIEPYALRLPAAIIGALTIPVVYWMVRTAYRTVRSDYRILAFWTAAFMAFSYWHLAFSRLGYRGILVPLTTAAALGFYWRGRNRLAARERFPWLDMILCGLLLGIGMHTYIAARVAPLLVVFLIAAEMVRNRADRPQVQRLLGGLALITVCAALVFLPLGLYFVEHPEYLGSRATAVSIFSPDFNGGSPARAAGRSAWQFAKMFVTGADLNERHNPAQRPLLGVVLTAWAAVGVLGALVRWRQPAYLFPLAWAALFALPSLLTLQGIPHSLRAIGMIPAIYLLIALGLLDGARWLGSTQMLQGDRSSWLGVLVPLPFFLWASVAGINDYFSAWERNDRLPHAFHSRYVDLMEEMAAVSGPDEAWVIPLAQELFEPGTTNYTMDFAFDGMARGAAGHAVIVTEPYSAADQLNALASGHSLINVVEWPNQQIPVEGAYLQADEKGYFPFMMQIYGEEIGEFPLTDAAYAQYRIEPGREIRFAPGIQPVDIAFGDEVRLTGVAMGGTHADPVTIGEDVRAGDNAWVVLRWEAQRDISAPLKAGLRLLSPGGHDAGRADELLVGNGYPFLPVWPAGETTYSYHMLPTRTAIPPDEYTLAVTVYEEEGGRILAGRAGNASRTGSTLAPIPVADMTVIAAGEPAAVEPDVTVAPDTFTVGDLELLGFDLPFNAVAPGVRLPLTLYWQKLELQSGAPADTNFELELLGPSGSALLETRAIAHADTLTSGEIIRDWQDLRIPVDAENGSYALLLRRAGDREFVAAELVVEGRPRSFDLPALAQESDGRFGDLALLRGLELPLPAAVDAGSALGVPLVWEAQSDGARPLIRFVHVLNSDGQLVAQQDSIPCEDACRTESWIGGEILRDVARIALPADLPPGSYAVVVGFYDPATGRRLPATDSQDTRLEHDVYFLPGRIEVGG